MDEIYDDAKDQNIAATVVYSKRGDNIAYADEKHTTQLKTSELKDAFLKRALIKVEENYYVPFFFSISNGIGSIMYSTGTDGYALTSVAD